MDTQKKYNLDGKRKSLLVLYTDRFISECDQISISKLIKASNPFGPEDING